MPARWDRKAPAEDFWCEDSSWSRGTVQAGLCAGNSQEVILCVTSEAELEYTLERVLPLAQAHDSTSARSAGSGGVECGYAKHCRLDLRGETPRPSCILPHTSEEHARSPVPQSPPRPADDDFGVIGLIAD